MIHLTILTLKETLFNGNVQSVTMPAEMGGLTILPNHVPLITALKKGAISALTSKSGGFAQEERKYIECAGGILEFTENEATVLL